MKRSTHVLDYARGLRDPVPSDVSDEADEWRTELVVALAIIAILVAILVPVVRKYREVQRAATRAQTAPMPTATLPPSVDE